MPKRDSAPLGAPCWIDLMTSDRERSIAFYCELFGWTSEDAGEEFGHYVTFSKDGVRVAGAMGNDPASGAPDGWSVYLASADAQATADAAVANGGTVALAPMPVGDLGTMAVLLDPAGAAIGVWQPGEHTGFGVVDELDTAGWFELHTRDFAAAVPFYEKVFGWDTHVASDTDDFRYTTFGEGDDALAGVMDSSRLLPEGVPSMWTVYFRVADTDDAVARAVSLGATVVRPGEDTPYGRLAQLTDVTGAEFKLVG